LQKLAYIAFLLALMPVCASGQESPGSNVKDAKPEPGERVKVYSNGPGTTPPALLARGNAMPPIEKCGKHIEGKVSLTLIIDSAGHPRNVVFGHPDGTVLDEFALSVAESDRFQAGTFQGTPAAFERTLEMQLKGCVQTTKDGNGKKVANIKLRQWPEQKLGDAPETTSEATLAPIYDPDLKYVGRVGVGITPPKALLEPDAEFSEYARKKKIQGTCVLTIVVDSHGMPRNIRVMRNLEPSLDANAILAVSRYRFKPAYRDGEPVPITVSVEVRFRLY
jgi:TonB family protein